MGASSEVDDLRHLVEQLQAEKVDLQHQVAALQQTNRALQLDLQQFQTGLGECQPPCDRPSFEVGNQFQLFMAHAPVLAWMTNAQGVMGYVNTNFLTALGMSVQQVIGQTLETLFPPDLAQDYRQHNQWVIEHQAGLETLEQALLPDGTTHTYLVRKFLVHSEPVTTPWVGGIAVDITDLKQAEAALRDSEARWQFALEGPGDGLWDWNLQTNDLFYSPQWKVMLGYADGEVGTSLDEWDSRVHPEDKAGCYADMEKHFSGETPVYQKEYRIRCKDGCYKWILDRGKVMKWDGHGKPLRVIGIHTDISDRKAIELALQATTEELDRFFSVSLDLLCIGDTSGYFHRLNGQWEKTLGYLVQEMQGTQYIDYVHPEDMEATLAALSSLTEQQEIRNFVNRYRCRDGSYRWIEWRSVPVGDLIYGAARDITDRKQAELTLERTKEQLDLVLQASSEGYWDWNLVTGEIYFSPQWKAMLGYADHELANSFADWEAVIFEADRVTALQLVDDYNSGRVEEFSVTQRFHHKDGSTIYILSRAIHQKNAAEQVVRMVGSHLDITAMVTIQAALQTSEMQLASVLDSSLDGIMAFSAVRDEVGTIVDFEWLLSNPSACTTVGRTADYLISKRLIEELPGNKTDGLFDLYVQVVETGEPLQRQFHYCHDGLNTWFEIIAVKLGDGFAVTFRDITPLKQSEQALQLMNQQLEIRVHELNQRTEQMQLLSEMSDFLQACITQEEAYRALPNLIEPLFPESTGGIFTLNNSRDRVENIAAWGDHRASIPDFSPQDCWALRRGRLYQVGPDCLGLRCSHNKTHAISTSTLCIPLLAQGDTLGLFCLSTVELPQPTQQLARTVAEQLSLALANLHLRETLQQQSIRDPLTGLFNRRYLEETLTREVERAQRQRHKIGVILLDIDHFKRFNDTYGHDAGDRVLETVAQLLRESVRGSDVACRYGGEEMILILPESPPGTTLARAEEIRQALSLLQISYNGLTLNALTASLGVASFPDHGPQDVDVFKAADAALYQAKAQGRNQVVVATVPASKVAGETSAPLPRDIS